MPNAAIGIINSVIGSDATFGGTPLIENTTQSMKEAWSVISGYEPRLNKFCNALVDRIGLTVMRMLTFTDPWKVFEKGNLPTGATVQEVYIAMQKATPFYDSTQASTDDLLKGEFGSDPADVSSAFHAVNSRIKYKVTINREELETAFTSEANLSAFVQNVINQIYLPTEYDAFIMKKYLIHLLVKNNKIHKETITAVTTEATGKAAIKKMRATYAKMKYLSSNYNSAGVLMNTPEERLYCITTSDFDASVDVDVLASAFNMDKTNFMGHRIGVDSFALNANEIKRLEYLLTGNEGGEVVATGGDKTYTKVTANDAALAGVAAIIVDKDFFQIYDKLNVMKSNELASTLDWNYFHHVWKVYSASPFANAVIFSSAT